MEKTYSKEEFQQMVAELEAEFHSIMKSEQESAQLLAKSEEDKAENEEKKDEEKKDEPKAEEQKEESKEEPKAEEAKEDEKKEDEKQDEESHGYDEEDLEEMHKMYSSMSKAEREAHKNAIEKCGEMSQMAKSEETSTEQKVEESKEEATEDQTSLLKSEIETIKKENEDLKKNIDGLVSAMNVFVTKKAAPARKAITDIDFIKKSEEENANEKEQPLSKSEIDKILAKKVVDPSLTPYDREAINEFYLTSAGVEKIKHLLKQ